jgi:zinc/manganese transport system permease protein
MIELLALPFLACLVLTLMHVHLGLHVLARGVIFVDLALAQVAALGLTVALLAGHSLQGEGAYGYALAFAVGGAVLFALTRTRANAVPQEAVIGIVYAVSAALAVIVLDRAPQGGEHIKQLLVGSILTVSARDVAALAGLYVPIGLLHWALRRPLLEVSLDPEGAVRAGRTLVFWDILFYASFALVVTSSVRVAGVLLVFAYLVVPAAIASLFVRSVRARLALGWALGAAISAVGLWASWAWDFPTGATLVAAFGAAIALAAAGIGAVRAANAIRTGGIAALRPAAAAASGLVALAGALLAVLPGMDHPWLDAVESAVPRVREAFLTEDELETLRDTKDSLARGQAELDRLRRMQQDVRWGTLAMDAEREERLRQFIAGRAELVAGDELVLRTLRDKARGRQRFPLGLSLGFGCGALAFFFGRRRRETGAVPPSRSA